MIAAQRDALEAARKSREDALKATKVRNCCIFPFETIQDRTYPDQEQLFGVHESRVTHAVQASGDIVGRNQYSMSVLQFILRFTRFAWRNRVDCRSKRDWLVNLIFRSLQVIFNFLAVQTAKQSCELLLKVHVLWMNGSIISNNLSSLRSLIPY